MLVAHSVVDAYKQANANLQHVIGLAPNQPYYRILVVDDTWESCQLLTEMLAPLGFEVRDATNGQEAIGTWRQWKPHLIFMDMRMLIMDGYEATQRIKATAQEKQIHPAPVIIALTASAFEDERASMLVVGCDDFIRKPFQEAEILNALQKHMGVQYVYEEPTAHNQAKLVQPTSTYDTLVSIPDDAALRALPPHILEQLRKALIETDPTQIDNAIGQIRSLDTTLADVLAVLADNFEYASILTMVEHALVHILG